MSAFRRAWLSDLALLGVVLIWGFTFPVIQDATCDGHVLSFLALRFAIALAAFAPLLVVAHRRGVAWRAHFGPGIVAGLGLLFGYVLQTYGLRETTSTMGGFLTGTSVVIVPLGAWAVLGQRLRRSELIGLVLVVAGLPLLSGLVDSAAASSSTGPSNTGRGQLLVLGCAVAFSVQILATAKHAAALDAVCFTAIQVGVVLVGSALLAPFELASADPRALLRWSMLGPALFTGLLATTLAFWVQTEAQRVTSPVHVVLIFSLEPIFAGIAGHLVHEDRLTKWQVAGAVSMFAGSLVAAIAPARAPAR